ncbi:hypothetical protein BHM03_00014877 [Ensete ventricosum]|nr:hypothetical protein BHM03_00014877 [Ensete ventricosum]
MGRTQEAGCDDQRKGVGGRSDAINTRAGASEGNQGLERSGHWRPRREIEANKEDEKGNGRRDPRKKLTASLRLASRILAGILFIYVSSPPARACVIYLKSSSAAWHTFPVIEGSNGSRSGAVWVSRAKIKDAPDGYSTRPVPRSHKASRVAYSEANQRRCGEDHGMHGKDRCPHGHTLRSGSKSTYASVTQTRQTCKVESERRNPPH